MRMKKSKPKPAAATSRYIVLAEIEHDGVLYVPKMAISGTGQVKAWEQRTSANRMSIRKNRRGEFVEAEKYTMPVDKTGFIRLTDAQAAPLFAVKGCPIALASAGEVIPRQDPGYPDKDAPVVPHYKVDPNIVNPNAPHARPSKPIVGNINETVI